MHSPKPPAPDPAIAAAQEAEQKRAEAGQVAQTQHGLNADTIALRRRFGIMAAAVGAPGGFTGGGIGSVPGITAAPSGGGSGFVATGGGGGGGFGGGIGGRGLYENLA